jgi:hypothetical protein
MFAFGPANVIRKIIEHAKKWRRRSYDASSSQ